MKKEHSIAYYTVFDFAHSLRQYGYLCHNVSCRLLFYHIAFFLLC